MRKFSVAGIALLVCLVAVPAFSWEFSMSGAFHSEYRYITQLGENGFFGPYDQVVIGEAINLYTGVHFLQISGFDIVGSSDAATHCFWMQIDPQIRINKAVRIRGRYRVGDRNSALGTFYDTKQYHSVDGGVLEEFAYGGWTMLWGSAQTPWGTIVLGKRPFAFGNGLMFDGTTTLSTDSILFVAPYGPFRFLIGQQAARSTGLSFNRANKTTVEEFEHTGVLTYSSGPMQLGTFFQYVSIHAGPETGVPTRDTKQYIFDQYMKYANGRFFLNAEIGGVINDTHFIGVAPTYTEHVRWMLEMGVLAGPLKVSAIYGSVPGGNNGADKSYQSGLVNNTVFAPYSMMIVRNYGSLLGNGGYSGAIYEGTLQDAALVGARADYAVAANLNVWIAGAYAERINNSQGWGCVAPTGPVGGLRANFQDQNGRKVPNSDLGWEIDAGIDWQLLEGLRILNEFAYFQPGDWCKHAFVDATIATGFGAANGFRNVNWQRSIDPILAYYITANFEF